MDGFKGSNISALTPPIMNSLNKQQLVGTEGSSNLSLNQLSFQHMTITTDSYQALKKLRDESFDNELIDIDEYLLNDQ